jgi:hypothetical protein
MKSYSFAVFLLFCVFAIIQGLASTIDPQDTATHAEASNPHVQSSLV